MNMTHCPVRVRDLSRFTFYKSVVPSSAPKLFTTHFDQDK